tara:strand:- start:7249 stop:7416 length:168 start_codon:yes stop_codon:yes gene_type:complete
MSEKKKYRVVGKVAETWEATIEAKSLYSRNARGGVIARFIACDLKMADTISQFIQ